MMETILKVDGINVYYGSIHAIKGISFEVNEGEIVTLIGANGAGKSTILKLMLGLLTPQSGTVRVDGLDMNKENIATIRRKLGFVLQNSDNQLFMPTVEEDMMFAPLNYGMDREEAEKKVDEVEKAALQSVLDTNLEIDEVIKRCSDILCGY